MFKTIVVIVVLLVAAAALWYTGLLSKWVPSIPTYQQMMSSSATTTPATATTTPQTQQQSVNDLPTQPNDASDNAINQDAAALDVQMSALSTDNANAQNSTNDTPVSQDY